MLAWYRLTVEGWSQQPLETERPVQAFYQSFWVAARGPLDAESRVDAHLAAHQAVVVKLTRIERLEHPVPTAEDLQATDRMYYLREDQQIA